MNETRLTRWLLWTFWPLTALVLFCDSAFMVQHVVCAQAISNLLAIGFWLALLSQMKPQRRLVASLFVPLSAIGEMIFTYLLGLYHYRTGTLPLYVPFGHAILLSVGLAYADHEKVLRHEARFKAWLLASHALLAASVLLFLRDALSVVFIAAFYAVLRGQCGRPFYFILGAMVCYVELVGTSFGCWIWEPSAFGVVPTVNPPLGAYGCYAIADFIALGCATLVGAWWARVRRGHQPQEAGFSVPRGCGDGSARAPAAP